MGYNGPKIFHTKRDYVRGGIKRLQNTTEGGIAPPSYAIPSEFFRISSTTFSIRLAVERLFIKIEVMLPALLKDSIVKTVLSSTFTFHSPQYLENISHVSMWKHYSDKESSMHYRRNTQILPPIQAHVCIESHM